MSLQNVGSVSGALTGGLGALTGAPACSLAFCSFPVDEL